ncbi:unnamed protein product [Candidula unifasciata]|uniref:Major facilitator superfamily (MFS) profile domain-containing protein n=1 Tax=Candidula unifasciata TaxID=100452 RepID=A0A8S3ZWB1_9EUPU|nr:unnamed protein product [Candidula unifasciata]
MYTLDTLFQQLGGCGRFQVIFVAMGYFPLLPATWGLVFMIFGNYNPGLECGHSSLGNLTSVFEYSNNSTEHRESNVRGYTEIPCNCDSIKTYKDWTFNQAASTVVTEWSLICDDAWKSSTIISVQMVGVFIGACAGGQIGDKFGRKVSVHGGAAMLIVTNIIAIFSVSWAMYAVVRFFIGLAVGSMLSTNAVYCMEFVPAWWRGFIGTFPFWTFSTFSYGLCVMALKNWKHVHIATAFVAMLAFLPVIWLPESMRFLAVHGHVKQANKVVKKIARLNKKPLPDTSIVTKIAEVEKESLKERSSYTYLHLFHRSIRKYTIVLGMTWFILSVSNNTIGFGLKAFSGDFFINLVIFLVLPFPARLFLVLITTKVGRKMAVASTMCLSFICSFVVVGIQLLAPEETRGLATTGLAFVANMIMEAGWGASVVLIVELFPTGVRNMAYAFCNGLARIGSMISPFLIPKQSLPMWGLFLLIGTLLLLCFISILTLPESKERPLQENLQRKAKKENSEIASSM